MQEKCYKKTVGEEATFLETAKDYFNQFKEIPAQKHWICLKNYFNQKCGSVMSLAPTPFPLLDIPFGSMCALVISLAWRFLLVRSCLVKYHLRVLPACGLPDCEKVFFIGRNSRKFPKFPFYPQGPIKFDIGQIFPFFPASTQTTQIQPYDNPAL